MLNSNCVSLKYTQVVNYSDTAARIYCLALKSSNCCYNSDILLRFYWRKGNKSDSSCSLLLNFAYALNVINRCKIQMTVIVHSLKGSYIFKILSIAILFGNLSISSIFLKRKNKKLVILDLQTI